MFGYKLSDQLEFGIAIRRRGTCRFTGIRLSIHCLFFIDFSKHVLEFPNEVQELFKFIFLEHGFSLFSCAHIGLENELSLVVEQHDSSARESVLNAELSHAGAH